MTKAELFREILKDLKAKRILDKKFYSVEVGLYEINKSGLKHAFSRAHATDKNHKKVEAELIKNIMQVITNSIFISFEPDYRGRAGVKGVYNYYNIVLFNGSLYEAWYKIKATKDKTFFYDMGIIREIK